MDDQNSRVEEPQASYGQPLSFDKVWLMFQETNKQFKETDKQFKETDKQFKETDNLIKELSKKADKRSAETERRFRETDKKMKMLHDLFVTQWGKLMETLVEGDLIKLLNSRGIDVHQTSQRVSGSYDGNPYEFDIIAVNGKEVVIVEVKTTLRVKDVTKFIEKLSLAKVWMPELRNKDIYGAVAYLTANSDSHIMSAKKGLFVIRATGSSASVTNKADFKPARF